jgi:hypothetical protein
MIDPHANVLEAMHGWRQLYQDEAARSSRLHHVLVTMLAQGAKLSSCTCAYCEQVRGELEHSGYLRRSGEG